MTRGVFSPALFFLDQIKALRMQVKFDNKVYCVDVDDIVFLTEPDKRSPDNAEVVVGGKKTNNKNSTC